MQTRAQRAPRLLMKSEDAPAVASYLDTTGVGGIGDSGSIGSRARERTTRDASSGGSGSDGRSRGGGPKEARGGDGLGGVQVAEQVTSGAVASGAVSSRTPRRATGGTKVKTTGLDAQAIRNTQPPSSIISPLVMLDRALAQNAAPETIQKLLDLHERWDRQEARKAFEEAVAAAKAEMPRIEKSRRVGGTGDTSAGRSGANRYLRERPGYRYEDLATVLSLIEPVLSKHGLSIRYRTLTNPDGPVSVTCILSHRGGHSEENTLVAARDDSGAKNSIQAIGSTVTYLQRYTLKAALGLAAAQDDDGVASSQSSSQRSASDAARPKPKERRRLLELLDRAGLSEAEFCRHWRIGSIDDLPQVKMNGAIAALNRRISYRNRTQEVAHV